MKTRVLSQSEAYVAPMTEVMGIACESFVAASNSIGADSWKTGNDEWCD